MARNHRVLPGFSLSLGYTVFYLSVLALIPLSACFAKAFTLTPSEFVRAAWTDRAIAAYKFSLLSASGLRLPAWCWGCSWPGCWCGTNFR